LTFILNFVIIYLGEDSLPTGNLIFEKNYVII
jgi:hypothetical protein